ncbi:hypothetical protein QCA50_017761 [Cerrena zonata]|uniref:Uncharacterized protein n=1 Tax=Cerrena zonata TaxID=2478898 RepID=A0AAW0FEA9_9APHY
MLAVIAKISPQDYWLQSDVNWKGFRPSKFEDIKLSCTIQAPSDADFPELDRHFTLGMANLRVLLNQCYNPKISKHEGVVLEKNKVESLPARIQLRFKLMQVSFITFPSRLVLKRVF